VTEGLNGEFTDGHIEFHGNTDSFLIILFIRGGTKVDGGGLSFREKKHSVLSKGKGGHAVEKGTRISCGRGGKRGRERVLTDQYPITLEQSQNSKL